MASIIYIPYGDHSILASSARIIVNTVNCEGVMGKGLALTVKQQYPWVMPSYIQACKARWLRPGGLNWVHDLDSGVTICNFATKDKWRDPSRLEWIEDGLQAFLREASGYSLESVAFPPLGCGLGGLDWYEVGHMMAQYLTHYQGKVDIYLPEGDAIPNA